MSWSTATLALAKKLPGYESRVEQDKLAEAIENALADGENLLAQAGCGTGKSLAYLVALAFRAKADNKPTVVATATKALQSQLAFKDLPFLQSIFPWLIFAVVKGRSNYVCRAKLADERAQDVANLAEILAELEEEGHSGDIETMRTPIEGRDRSLLTVVADECPGKKECPFGEICFAEMAKTKAQDAHVVVANHAVLIADALVKLISGGKAGMLPHYGALAVDEAHELEEYATSALGTTFGESALTRLGNDVAVFLRNQDAAYRLNKAASVLFTHLALLMPKKDNTLRLTDELLIEVFGDLESVAKEVRGLLADVRAVRVDDEDAELAKKRIVRRVEGTVGRLERVIMADGDEIVRWIERSTSTFHGKTTETIKLAFAPMHVGQFLRSQLWDLTPSVLVSATLSTGERGFDFIAERLGLQDPRTFDAGSPFDFPRQARLYVPLGKDLKGTFPSDPKDGAWQARMTAEAGELIRAAGGRTLFLFTSRRSMDATYEALLPTLRSMKVTVLKQGDAPNGQLSETFKADETSVLFALKSFMTGADFQGDTLRLVILDKLPFPVPTDVIFQARAEQIDARARAWKEKSFMALSVPTMVLTLLQAFGRAVRTKQDEALVAIMDPRLWSKGYGRGILNALPPAQRTSNFVEAEAYLQALTARRSLALV